MKQTSLLHDVKAAFALSSGGIVVKSREYYRTFLKKLVELVWTYQERSGKNSYLLLTLHNVT